MYTQEMLDALDGFYKRVNKVSEQLWQKHTTRLQCRMGCHSCCVDDLEVFGIEAEYIKKNHAALLKDGQAHPSGKCAFLDTDGACRIYYSRPLVCRTHGFPLRWIEEMGGIKNEYRDICPLNEEGVAIEKLHQEDCLHTTPLEEYLAKLQILADDGMLHKVALRSLFKTTGI